jgi:hypothetical protein
MVQRSCQEFKTMLELENKKQQLLIAQVSEQKRVLSATQLETQREMDGLELKAAMLEEENVATAALLLGVQEQVQTAMVEASEARVILTADVDTNTIPILDESETTWTSKFNVKKYLMKKFFSILMHSAKDEERGCNTPNIF